MIAPCIEILKGKPLILIDWGDTLMRDDPAALGPMCDWSVVEAMPEAAVALRYMTTHFSVALATGASCSNREQIMQALKRAGLDQWISVIFLSSEIGSSKASTQFYSRVAALLGIEPQQMAMIGNDLDSDVRSARAAGLHAFWVPAVAVIDQEERGFTLMEAAKAAVERLTALS